MGATISSPIKNKEKFTIRTEAALISDEGITAKDRQKAIQYLNSPAFKKRATFDLQSNFMNDKKIKIIVDSIKVQNNLTVVIHGTVKVLKAESEPKDVVKSVLEGVLPQYSSQGERMPTRSSHFRIQFKHSSTSVEF
jgi:hypothetical protein